MKSLIFDEISDSMKSLIFDEHSNPLLWLNFNWFICFLLVITASFLIPSFIYIL